jgi:hypothetical protein
MERRKAKRWRARLSTAKLFDASRRFLVECRVMELSATGARLKPQSDRPLPFDLHYQDDNREVSTAAALIWIRKGEIGIRFVEEPEQAG